MVCSQPALKDILMHLTTCRLYKSEMKQLDVVVSPPAFVWDPNLTLTHVTFQKL